MTLDEFRISDITRMARDGLIIATVTFKFISGVAPDEIGQSISVKVRFGQPEDDSFSSIHSAIFNEAIKLLKNTLTKCEVDGYNSILKDQIKREQNSYNAHLQLTK